MIKAFLCGEEDQWDRNLGCLTGERDQWDRNLGCLTGAYRATPNESTGLTPNLLVMGREVRIPSELVFNSLTTTKGPELTSCGDYVDILWLGIQQAHCIALDHLGRAASRHKAIYDAKIAVNKYKPGDIVW